MAVQTTYPKAPSAAVAGQLYDHGPHDIITMRNAESTASMPFGIGVAFKTSSPATDLDAILLSGSGDLVAGIIVHSEDYARTFTLPDGTTAGELGSSGLRPGSILQILRKGRIWVTSEDAITVGLRPFIRFSANGGNTQVGAFRGTDDSGHAIDLTKIGQFSVTSGGAGALVVLEVDFTNKP